MFQYATGVETPLPKNGGVETLFEGVATHFRLLSPIF